MKVSVEAGVVAFEVKLSEFVHVVRDFVGARLDKPAREAIKKMIEEVDKDFALVVGALTPLFAINTDADVRTVWRTAFQDFKTEYFTKWNSLATHCQIVSAELQRLQKAHDWKRRLPVLRKAVTGLETLGQRWMANDQELYTAMNAFMDSTNRALTEVNALSRTPAKALRKLRAVLRGTETGLLRIKAYSNELKQISAALDQG